jgi:hypothetical protein
VYTVHEPPDPPADRIERAARVEFVKDAFSWGAFLFGPLWLAYKREWIGLGLYFAAVILVSGSLSALGAGPEWTGLGTLALGLVLGFEASSLRRATLDRQGWTELGTVSGRDLAECERRFFEDWLPGQPAIAARRSPPAEGSTKASIGDLGATVPPPRTSGSSFARRWRKLFDPRST